MHVGMVGAGIRVATAALALGSRGHAVTVIDRSDGKDAAVMGNAGAFADAIPLANPGILRRALSWLTIDDRDAYAHGFVVV